MVSNTIIKKYNERDKIYDKITKHGLLQGSNVNNFSQGPLRPQNRGLRGTVATRQPLSKALTVIMFKRIANWFKAREESKKLENWFSVTWDTEYIYRNVSPPGKEAWNDKFKWADIERICFEATDHMYSDDIYFFTTERPESYVIPTEAKGGSELWELVLDKKLFDAEQAIEAATSPEGMFCWPKPNS